MNTAFICVTCGSQHAPSAGPPASCPICDDERQYRPATGQAWTTLAELRRGHRNAFVRHEPDLYGLGTVPQFGLGPRALLVRTPGGNILWDCTSLIDDATVDLLRGLGGIRAIAVSHPHLYGSMVEWSHAFDRVPVLLHQRDRRWVMRPDPVIMHWEGAEHELLPGIRLIHFGGHFAGSTALLWAAGAEGRGALLTGDTINVVQDRRFVSFMRSYPNLIPLPPATVERIAGTAAALRFDRIYGGWWDSHIPAGAHAAVQLSARRYAGWSRGESDPDAPKATFDSAAESTRLLQRDAEWAQAASDGKDIEQILSYWSEDAVVIPQGQPVAEGKAAIRAFVTGSLAIPGFKIHWVSNRVSFSPDGNLAYLRSTNEITVPGPGGSPVTLPGRGLTIWRVETDGQWRCVVDIWNDPASASGAPAPAP